MKYNSYNEPPYVKWKSKLHRTSKFETWACVEMHSVKEGVKSEPWLLLFVEGRYPTGGGFMYKVKN